MRIKWVALLVLLPCLGTALAMAVSGREDNSHEVVGNVDKNTASLYPAAAPHETSQSAILYDLSALKRAVPDSIQPSQLFQPKTWYSPPPPTRVSSLPPPPPSAPLLNFTFLGRMIDGNDVILFLSKDGHQYTVKVNDVMDDTYRLDKITNSNAVLTYLPMNVQQTLVFNSDAIGSSSMNDARPQTMTSSSKSP